MTTTHGIAYPLRIGVTGDRTLPEDLALVERIIDALRRIRALVPASPATPVHLAVISPLAEGADCLLAEIVLDEPGATLEVLLPLPYDEYLRDFPTERSRQEFEFLLARASRGATLPAAGSGVEAYAEVGPAVPERNRDVRMRQYGGSGRGPGGPAEIVQAADESGLPVFRIDSMPPFELVESRGAGIQVGDFRRLVPTTAKP